jgi:putative salt-induced outer membrane protein YdiY
LAGGNIQSGNNDRSAFAFAAEAVRRGDKDRFSLQFLYNIGQDKGTMSTRNAFGAMQYDYFFTKQWYGLLSVSLFNDTFQDLNLRVIVGPGIGYQVWDDKQKYLSLEAGVAYLSEDLKSHPDKSWFTARLAGNFKYHITDNIFFSDQLILYPSLENFSDFQLRNEAALTTSLGASWSLKLANILDYVNSPAVGVKSTDSNVILGIQYGF